MRNVGSSVDKMRGWGAEGEGRWSGEEDGGQGPELRPRGWGPELQAQDLAPIAGVGTRVRPEACPGEPRAYA